jgi:hypothetical protein
MPPTATTGQTPAPVFVCVMAHTGPHGVAQRGEHYRADDPLVIANPHWFVSADTPENEWGVTPFDGFLATIETENRANEAAAHQARVDRCERNRVTLKAPTVLVAKRDVLDLSNGRKVLKGSTILADDELAVEHPDDFKPA